MKYLGRARSAGRNLTHGERVLNKKQKPTAVVTPMRDGRGNQAQRENYWHQKNANADNENYGNKRYQSVPQNQIRRSVSKESSPMSHTSKKSSPNACPNVTPPDPKNLPKPIFQMQTKKEHTTLHKLETKPTHPNEAVASFTEHAHLVSNLRSDGLNKKWKENFFPLKID